MKLSHVYVQWQASILVVTKFHVLL